VLSEGGYHQNQARNQVQFVELASGGLFVQRKEGPVLYEEVKEVRQRKVVMGGKQGTE
jgi:hypothetical protein